MKEIKLEEQKKIIIEMLKYVTDICKKNNIKYSLIGGSLIGAIRHQGIIPWDDDIDIILMPKEFEKLIKELKRIEKDSNYKIISIDNNSSYICPFTKLIDSRTYLQHKNIRKVNGYGVYLDIFKYGYLPNNSIFRKIHYCKIMLYKKIIEINAQDEESVLNEKNFIKRILKLLIDRIGSKEAIKRYDNLFNKYNSENKKYVISNWPTYGYKHEVQKADNMKNFKFVKFDRIDAMITENYDEILKTTFGDYMKLPPEEKRITHNNTEIYWKDNNYKES